LLVGAFNLPFEQIRTGGIGEQLSRVFESDGFEALLLSGATSGMMALVQLLVATAILALGAEGILNAGLVVLWTALACAVFLLYMRRRRHWAQMRLSLTNTMVEHLVGHQTRLAQESHAQCHRSEDAGLATYQAASRNMDRSLLLNVVIVRGWLPVGLAGLAYTFVHGGAGNRPCCEPWRGAPRPAGDRADRQQRDRADRRIYRLGIGRSAFPGGWGAVGEGGLYPGTKPAGAHERNAGKQA
jgi:hypothetical protein